MWNFLTSQRDLRVHNHVFDIWPSDYPRYLLSMYVGIQHKLTEEIWTGSGAKKCSVSEPEPLGAVLFFLEPESKLCYFRLQLRLKVNCKTHREVYSDLSPPLRGGKRNEKIRNREEKSKGKRRETKMRTEEKRKKRKKKEIVNFLPPMVHK